MNENERIVCEFLRKIAPSREWEYLGEVEHYWIGELCDELNRQLKAENTRLRSELESVGLAAYLYGRNELKSENADNRNPETMTENGWVKLPVDVDGVPIRIGDVLKDSAEFKSEGVVERLMLDELGWFVGFGNGWTNTTIHKWRHYHELIVEDVLHNFICDVEEGVRDEEEIIAEYAAKLRLANDK